MPPRRRTYRLGDRVEARFHKDNLWYAAKLTGISHEADGTTQVFVHYDGCKAGSSHNTWMEVGDPALRVATSDANSQQRYIDACGGGDGHIEGEYWEVEKILDMRGEGDERECFVRWAGEQWTEEDDSWEPIAEVATELVEAFIAPCLPRSASPSLPLDSLFFPVT